MKKEKAGNPEEYILRVLDTLYYLEVTGFALRRGELAQELCL